MTDTVLVHTREATQGSIGIITLNSEKTLNSLTLGMVQTIRRQLLAWQDDDTIALVLIEGAGDRAFCAGGDVQQIYHSAISSRNGACEYAESFFQEEYRLDYLIHTFTKPVACWVNGIVMGGGLGLVAGASHRIGTETTRIAMPEITIGLYPDVGATYFLNRMPHKLGLFLGLTAASINLSDAAYVGLINYSAPAGKRSEFLHQLSQQQWQSGTNRPANSAILDELLQTYAVSAPPAGNLEVLAADIEAACGRDGLKEVIAAIAELDGDSAWLRKAQRGLQAGSPLAAWLIYEQLQRGANLDLAGAFQAECLLSTNVVRYPEFTEGVRALLIEKDNTPKWQFPRIEDVPAKLIETFFVAPWVRNPLSGLIPTPVKGK
ncbi:enoyl-CoA hydratase/isomerase family protein [Microbulbifer sp. SAOS-129_SWC]|uniref:enoyl-CoA hydratase/isomerase family protein n=1 Tax=Microbulbifer sp. SAOS-129_SWC TaxID=3145235 RepID=UPI003216BA42